MRRGGLGQGVTFPSMWMWMGEEVLGNNMVNTGRKCQVVRWRLGQNCQLFVYIHGTFSAICLHFKILYQLFVYIMESLSAFCLQNDTNFSCLFTF